MVKWLKRVAEELPDVPDDEEERKALLCEAQEHLELLQTGKTELSKMADTAQTIVAVNHLADRMYAAYGMPTPERRAT